MKPVVCESELGRCTILLPLVIADSMKPKERLKTVGYRIAICTEIQNQSYRRASETINRSQHRIETDQEVSVGTIVDDIEQEGKAIRLAKMDKTSKTLIEHGFDSKTTLYPGEIIPQRYRNRQCDMIIFNCEELTREIVPGWLNEGQDTDIEYSLPDTEIFQVKNKRRGKRHEVPAEKKEASCNRFIKWFNGTVKRKYYGIIHNWEIECSSKSVVYISIDVVFVDKQIDTRCSRNSEIPAREASEYKSISGDSYEENDEKRIGHVNIRVEADGARYFITTLDMDESYRQLIAFLLHNGLCNRYLIFFMDGEDSLFKRIESYFKGRWEYGIILDWMHLEHKVYDRMSNIIKSGKVPDPRGKIEYYKQKSKSGQIRKQDKIAQSQLYARELIRILWVGNVKEAIDYLNNLNPGVIYNPDERNRLITYLSNKAEWISCYAIRKQAGLRNSSNGVEGENRILVADRQKHNGTSWRPTGSSNLSAITCLFKNNEQNNWFFKNEIRFSML